MAEEASPTPWIESFAGAVREAGGRALEAGGAVRDRLLGRAPRDTDLEVYGLRPRALEAVIARFGTVRRVGAWMEVYVLKGVEIALPQGPGGTEDPGLAPEAASRRRDLTVNALLRDPLTGEILDFHEGRADLRWGRLRHVDDGTFVEDPLRLLRVVRLHAELGFRIAPETGALCRRLDLAGVAWERIGQEVERWLLGAERPGRGLDALIYTGAERHFPILRALLGCPVPRAWQAEDAWSHTRAVLEAAAARRMGERERDWPLMLAAVLAASGRPDAARLRAGNRLAPDHPGSAAARAPVFLAGVDRNRDRQAAVAALVREQDEIDRLMEAGAEPPAYRRLALRVDSDLLLRLAEAQAGARGEGMDYPAGERARTIWADEDLLGKAPKPLVQGKDLEGLGIEPGPKMGEWLDRAFDAQLDGAFTTREEGVDWLRKRLSD